MLLFGNVFYAGPYPCLSLVWKPFLHAESSSFIKGCSLLTHELLLNTTWLFKREVWEDSIAEKILSEILLVGEIITSWGFFLSFFLSLASHVWDGGVALGEALVSFHVQNQAFQHIPWLFWDTGEQSYLCRFGSITFYKDLLWDVLRSWNAPQLQLRELWFCLSCMKECFSSLF